MTSQPPITPPFELREQWYESADSNNEDVIEVVAIQAARWGADQELEACCSQISFIATRTTADSLRSLRRPKPTSLRKQAYDALDTYVYGDPNQDDKVRTYNTIRAALEALPND
jgi:hypothetical protein